MKLNVSKVTMKGEIRFVPDCLHLKYIFHQKFEKFTHHFHTPGPSICMVASKVCIYLQYCIRSQRDEHT